MFIQRKVMLIDEHHIKVLSLTPFLQIIVFILLLAASIGVGGIYLELSSHKQILRDRLHYMNFLVDENVKLNRQNIGANNVVNVLSEYFMNVEKNTTTQDPVRAMTFSRMQQSIQQRINLIEKVIDSVGVDLAEVINIDVKNLEDGDNYYDTCAEEKCEGSDNSIAYALPPMYQKITDIDDYNTQNYPFLSIGSHYTNKSGIGRGGIFVDGVLNENGVTKIAKEEFSKEEVAKKGNANNSNMKIYNYELENAHPNDKGNMPTNNLQKQKNTAADKNYFLSDISNALNSKSGNKVEQMSFKEQLNYLMLIEQVIDSLPISEPVAFSRITSKFGYRTDPFHKRRSFHTGIDLAAPLNTQVISTGAGIVVKAKRSGACGLMVMIDHGYDHINTIYCHLSKIHVNVGQLVKRGDLIGLVGLTGRTNGEHLHYEVRINDHPVNPLNFLKANFLRTGDEIF